MNNTTPNTSDWTPCPPGMLRGQARRARGKALGLLAMRTVVCFLLVAGAGMGSWWGYTQYSNRDYQFNGLTCADVRKLLPDLQAGKLNARLEGMLRQHVARCPACEPLQQQLPPASIAAALGRHDRPCPCCGTRIGPLPSTAALPACQQPRAN